MQGVNPCYPEFVLAAAGSFDDVPGTGEFRSRAGRRDEAASEKWPAKSDLAGVVYPSPG